MKLITAVLTFALSASALHAQKLNGAGATFPNPIYQKWFSEYQKAHNSVEINYQSVGSGAGIRQLTAGTVDFGASDGPMTDQQLVDAGQKVLHIPTVLGAVVPAYNVPGVKTELKFTPDVLAGLFLGRINNWNDAAIAKANPGVSLPNLQVIIVHRSDSSGTSFIWTDYLSKISPDWKSGPGASTAVKWPVGIGAKGNEGVAGMVRQMDGALGYVELVYAEQNHIPYGSVKNAAGEFVKASLDSTTAAAATAKIPADYRVSITNAPGKTSYPIASFTWLLVPADWKDKTKEKVFVDFLNWMINDGQKMTTQLTYAPLPAEVQQRLKTTIASIK